jgi:transaldolase / glucose-6-phosphate isomerase
MSLAVVTRGPASEAVATVVPNLVDEKIASRIFSKDSTIWGKDAEAESSIRLGWVEAAAESLALLPELSELRSANQAKGLTRVVLCGMGGSSLAPEVLASFSGVELVVLDSTYPSQVLSAVSDRIESTVVVVSSKSGSTVETDSQKRIFEQAFDSAGIDKRERIFIVTDPNSPMHNQALLDGYRVFLANPNVGGRFSALTAFGVVPSALAGVDMKPILLDAISASDVLRLDNNSNPALILGSALARTQADQGFKDKIGIVAISKSMTGFGFWMEQLIAESTGKLGKGVLPVVLDTNSPELALPLSDLITVGLVDNASEDGFEVTVAGSLGGQLLLWEVTTAVVARLLGVNPFDQPDVESAKVASRAFLEQKGEKEKSLFEDLGVRVSAKGLDLDSDLGLKGAIEELLAAVGVDGYISIHAYLDRERDLQFEALRDLITRATSRPTTFGWGPRFLHSTGQYHKGGPSQGVFIQIIGEEQGEVKVPGRDFDFQELMNSQAAGDANVLAEAGRPVLTLRLRDINESFSVISNILREF